MKHVSEDDGGRLRSLGQWRLEGAASKPVKLRVLQSTRRALNTLERLTMKSLSETQSKDLGTQEQSPWEGTRSSQPGRICARWLRLEPARAAQSGPSCPGGPAAALHFIPPLA